MIYYYVESKTPQAHLFNIRMHVTHPIEGQRLSLANWIPGSYLIRDYARHLLTLNAYAQVKGRLEPLKVEKLDSHTWQCAKTQGELIVEYTVYAFDPSVRGAYLDDEHAFFNGCALFLCAQGHEEKIHKVKISPPQCLQAPQWRVATTLACEGAPWEYGWYYANNYDELIDHPVEIGQFEVVQFRVAEIPHSIVVSGKNEADWQRLAKDVKSICEAHLRLFETFPFDQYLFLLTVRKEAYGGLEHRSSCALQIDSNSLPYAADPTVSLEYMNLLGLFSHEYFHAWHVKKIKPACFMYYDLSQKVYTKQLWAFEGITTYYESLALVRAKIISKAQYFDLLSRAITKLLRNPGRKVQTLAEASFDSWIKFYQPNENSNNALVSYYLKGALVALLLDLMLRQQHQHSLDEVMRQLWKEYGQPNRGLDEGQIESIIGQLGKEFAQLLHQALYTTQELPFATVFKAFGLRLILRAACSLEDSGGRPTHQGKGAILGMRVSKNQSRVMVAQVIPSVQKVGIGVGDELVAINGIRVDAESFEKISQRLIVGQTITIYFFKQDTLREAALTLSPPLIDTAEIQLEETSDQLNSWLGE